MDKLLTTKLTN